MREQHDLPEAERLPLPYPVDDLGRGAHQTTFAQTETRSPETLLGELANPGQRPFQTSAYRATKGSVNFSPTPPTVIGGRGRCTGPGTIGMSRTV